VRKQNEVGVAPASLRRAALAVFCVVVGCLNPRPEELPSAVETGPNVPGELGPERDMADSNLTPLAPEDEDSAGIDAAGAAPKPKPQPTGAPASAPAPEPPDAGVDAASGDAG
jgi:hypothetical protein